MTPKLYYDLLIGARSIQRYWRTGEDGGRFFLKDRIFDGYAMKWRRPRILSIKRRPK
jgi:hypothetical protein